MSSSEQEQERGEWVAFRGFRSRIRVRVLGRVQQSAALRPYSGLEPDPLKIALPLYRVAVDDDGHGLVGGLQSFGLKNGDKLIVSALQVIADSFAVVDIDSIWAVLRTHVEETAKP